MLHNTYEGRSKFITGQKNLSTEIFGFGSKNLRGQMFLTGDEFKYTPEKRLNWSQKYFIFVSA